VRGPSFGHTAKAVWGKSRQPQGADTCSLLCYLAAKELGMSMTDLAKRFNLIQLAVSIAARQGKEIARENEYKRIDG
jgi:hypothetical protein